MTKRIAFVLPNLGGGGAERVALTLIKGLVERGHAIDLVLLRAEGELLPLVPSEVRIVNLKAKRIRGAILPLARYLREHGPDAVQARMWPVTVVAILARLLARSKARLVVSDHSTLSSQYGTSRRRMASLKLSTRLLYPLADGRICVSSGCADDLVRLSGLSRDRFSVINNPADILPAATTPQPDIEQLWPGFGKRILTVGSLKPAKNHALLLRAFALLRDRIDSQLMILGEGPLRPMLEQQARDLGVAERLAMPGFAADTRPFYASADLFVLSSDWEGYPNVLIEAMLAGLPIVSTDCASGPREILDGGRYGTLVPCGDADALGEAMAAALGGPHDPNLGRARALELSADATRRYEELLLGLKPPSVLTA
jgi:glycosyltransferase involved in cell wall biosynthesis